MYFYNFLEVSVVNRDFSRVKIPPRVHHLQSGNFKYFKNLIKKSTEIFQQSFRGWGVEAFVSKISSDECTTYDVYRKDNK